MSASEHAKHLLREAEEVGCAGLLSGKALNIFTQKPFYASDATRANGPFMCPICKSDAVVKKCSKKIDHFAHIARLTPVASENESQLHLKCKTAICSELALAFPDGKWEVERTIPASRSKGTPELRPDVSGRIRDQRLAIEVQVSSLTPTKIRKRLAAYTKLQIPLLWIVPLRSPIGTQEFRPRLYERYIHSLYFGRTYYWWDGMGRTVLPVHYGPAIRVVDLKEWIEHGVPQYAGGYETKYKIIKPPQPLRPISIDEDFDLQERGDFTPENERLALPRSLTWQDTHVRWWSDA